ncbi:MAG: hydrogenase maturation protease [Euryarchaeota archaeon]|nr:hydrogenase maturation protease [Euryarchaeota archaeon]
MKTIVLGVGNPILKDDGVGIHVIRQLKKYVKDPDVTLDEAMTGGMNLLDMIIGYEKAILIDTVKMKGAKTGEVRRFSLRDFPSVHSSNPHDVDLLEAIKLAQKLGETRIPKEIVVIGISVNETQHVFGEQLSERMAKAVPKAVETVISELKIR